MENSRKKTKMSIEKDIKYNEKKQDETKNKVEYDDLLSAAGELGCYQWRLCISSFPFYIFGVFVYLSQIFITEVSPNHWCNIPELANLTDIQRRDLGVPKDANARFGYSQCEMYDVNWTEVLKMGQKPDDTWNVIPCQHGWEFNKTEIPYPSIGIEMEWVCEKNSYQATAQSIFFVGGLVGGFIFGWISDQYGRISAIMLSSIIGCVGGFASAFARNFFEFTAARFIMGLSYDTCMITAYLVILEYIAPKYRTVLANVSFAIFYSFIVTVMPWIALACGHWKTIALVTSVPLILGGLSKFYLPESPRWLLSKGRVDDAISKVQDIAKFNKKEVPLEMIEQYKSSVANEKEEPNQSWIQIFKRPILRKMFILASLEYMCCNLVFEGLIRSIGQLDFDFFVSFSVISFTELPSVIIVAFAMDYTGRRWLCIICMGISCIFCFLTVFATGVNSVIYAVVARFAVNMSFMGCMQWVPEILPTSVRGSGVAIAHMCGYVASVITPYITYLKEYIYWLPLVIVGSLAGVGMLIAFTLPETTFNGMPHTFEEADDLMKNQNIWSMPFLETRKKKRLSGQVNESFELVT